MFKVAITQDFRPVILFPPQLTRVSSLGISYLEPFPLTEILGLCAFLRKNTSFFGQWKRGIRHEAVLKNSDGLQN